MDAGSDAWSGWRGSDPRRRLIVALDVPDAATAMELAASLAPDLRAVKVGLELFAAAGPEVVVALVQAGLQVFVDLKLHDIPNTMAAAARSVQRTGASLCTIHALAGRGIGAAVDAITPGEPSRSPSMAILGVTVLTSHTDDELRRVLGPGVETATMVEHLAAVALAEGAHGLVASPREVEPLRARFGDEPLLVIPGIRPRGSDRADQSRVAPPGDALRDGADLLVVGRPITRDPDPRRAMGLILDEMAAAL